MMSPVVARLCLLGALVGPWSCMESNHDLLAARPEVGGAGGKQIGAGGTEAGAPDAASDDGSSETDGPPSEDVADAPEEPAVTPDGPSMITFVNGMPDAPAVRLCFLAGTAGALTPVPVAPIPDDPAGLAFARSMVRGDLPGIDLAAQDLRPIAYSGDMAALAGLACDQLQTPPAGVTRSALQLLPAGSLSAGRSVLIVLAGCVGGPGHETSSSNLVCGSGYAPDKPTAGLLVATMARAPVADRIGLQAFGGSLAGGTLTLRYASSEQYTNDIAFDVPPGMIGPKPPATNLTAQTLGANPSEGRWNIYEKYQTAPTTYTLLPEALARGGLAIADLVDGRNYTVVWVGARPGASAGTWWSPFTLLVIRSDP